MSRDEHLVTLIQETLRDTLERRSDDLGAVERVGVAVRAALGQAPEEEQAQSEASREPAVRASVPSDRAAREA